MDAKKEPIKYTLLAKKVLASTDKLWIPPITESVKVKSNSWFDITETLATEVNPLVDAKLKISDKKGSLYAEKIKIYPTNTQRTLLLDWMYSYTRMYNETIRLMKELRKTCNWTIKNWQDLRTGLLTETRNKIVKNSMNVNVHVLDFAIQDACAKMNAGLTNLKNGHIKHFRLRYLKHTRDSMIIKIEKSKITKLGTTFYSSVFKESWCLKKLVNGKLVDFSLKDIKCDFIIHYNRSANQFTLFNPVKTEIENLHKNGDSTGLDPGLRKFMTGYSSNKCFTIGSNMINKIGFYLNKIDRIEKADLRLRIKNKARRRCYNKITNLIDDMHWKAINYLINNFDNIIIGNLSTKRIVEIGRLPPFLKRIASLMRLYVFRQRLQYKCERHQIGYTLIDEAYTSVTCTKCANKKVDLSDAEIYDCNKCKTIIDRDHNGARNILMLSL